MSKFKLQFKLKQHTPIIHFQYDQYGATLRASELKPKLDKFLIKKLELTKIKIINGNEKEIPKVAYETWFINQGKEHLALNYKVKINTNLVKIENFKIGTERSDGYPNYFANMGNDYKKKPNGSSFATKSLELQIICLNELKNKIEELLPFFFMETNFGTRQNKGFGSFYLENKSPKSYPYLSIHSNSTFKDVFNVINYYFQRLKSGINYDYTDRRTNENFVHYKHSFLKIYLENNTNINFIWEKRWMKEKFIGLEPNNKNEKFARMMLGLVDGYTFKPKNHNRRRGEIYPKYELKIDVKSEEIERFKSPIMFKPLKLNNEWRIYIITNEIPLDILNKSFVFKSDETTETIQTPDVILDLKDLIDKYNLHLGNEFTSYTFVGKKPIKVKIKN